MRPGGDPASLRAPVPGPHPAASPGHAPFQAGEDPGGVQHRPARRPRAESLGDISRGEQSMNEPTGSCEVNPTPRGTATGSRVFRFQPDFRRQDVPVTTYKQAAGHWSGVARTVLVGDAGEQTAFHVRYFE